MDLMDLKEQRERRAYEVLGQAQTNYEKMERRYKRLQLMLLGRYAWYALVVMLILGGVYLWM